MHIVLTSLREEGAHKKTCFLKHGKQEKILFTVVGTPLLRNLCGMLFLCFLLFVSHFLRSWWHNISMNPSLYTPENSHWKLKMMVTKRNFLFQGGHFRVPFQLFRLFVLSDLKWRPVLDPVSWRFSTSCLLQWTIQLSKQFEISNKKRRRCVCCVCCQGHLIALPSPWIEQESRPEGFEVSQCACVCVCNIEFQSLRGVWKRMRKMQIPNLGKTLLC